LTVLDRNEAYTVTCPSLTRCRPAAAELLGDLSRVGIERAQDTGHRLAALVRRDDRLGQFARFVLVGGTSTAFYAVLFLSLQGLGYFPAHLVATVASSVLANDLHRRLTFHAGQRVSWLTAQVEAGGVSFVGLVATSAALGWLDSAAGSAHPFLQISLVASVTGLIGLLRFVALRWIFRPSVPSPA
jgi:putative flippase GtrA